MVAQAFRSPLAKFALALWMGCLHWPFTIPFVCALPLLHRSSKGRTQAWSMLILFALGWTANSVQEAFDPVLTAPKTARWTCKRNAGANARKPQFTCVNTAGNAYTAEAEVAPPLHSSFLGTLWPFRSASWRRFKHSQGVHGTIRATLPHTLPAETISEQNLPNHVLWTFLNRHFTGAVPGLLFALSSGNKRQLDPALKIRLNHAGLAHLMAVSGYHVGLVSFPLLLFIRHRRSAFRFIGFVGLVGTWSFIGFCGFPTSAVRAGLMITGYSLSQLARLNLSAMQLLSLAAWSMLIYCPGWSRDLGMQLSFVAVYAILLGIELLKVSHIRHPIALYLAVPVAAQLGTGFIAWPTFGVFPKFFLFFNLLASPLMALLGTALVGIVGADLVLGWRAAVHIGSWAVDGALNQLLTWLASSHSPAWIWNLHAVDGRLLMALSLGWLVGGTLVVAQRLSLRRSLWAYCAVGLALIPWIGWQAHHRIAVGFRYGLVIDGASSMAASMVTHARDSTRLVVQKAAIGADNGCHAVLLSNPLAKHAADTWAISPSRNAGFGQIKSRPFAWQRMDGSTIRFNYGADTVHLGQWSRPAFIE